MLINYDSCMIKTYHYVHAYDYVYTHYYDVIRHGAGCQRTQEFHAGRFVNPPNELRM